MRQVRVGNLWVRLVDVDTGQVIFTDDVKDAGAFTEQGAQAVLELLRDLTPELTEGKQPS
jgi:hypothetical protein